MKKIPNNYIYLGEDNDHNITLNILEIMIYSNSYVFKFKNLSKVQILRNKTLYIAKLKIENRNQTSILDYVFLLCPIFFNVGNNL